MALRVRSSARGSETAKEERRSSVPSFGSASSYAVFQRALRRELAFRPTLAGKQATDSFSKSQILKMIIRSGTPPSHSSIGAEKNLLKKRRKLNSMRTKTDLQKFARVEADKFALAVNMKDYGSFWRWLRSERSNEPIRIRLQKWVKTSK
jgi:hypothetical protein